MCNSNAQARFLLFQVWLRIENFESNKLFHPYSSIIFPSLSLAVELEESLSNSNTIMRKWRAFHSFVIHFIREDANRMTIEENLGNNLVGELGVSLNCEISSRRVEALHFADLIRTERD